MSCKISHSTIFGAPAVSTSSTFTAGAPLYAFPDCEAGLFLDVTPDFDEVERSLQR